MMLGLRLLVSPILRLTKPGMTSCQRCGWPWAYVKPHLYYFEPNESIFFLCEDCWPETNGVTRLIYGSVVVRGWGKGWRRGPAWPDEKAQKVLDALGREPV